MESECQTDRSYTPVSPLPSTLMCCPRDDTVCNYCGVSYLVLHEIADLEAKIVLLEQNQVGKTSEADWARGALQAACHALVQRELGDARAKAEARIQSLARAYEEERQEVREELRQVGDLARSIWDAAQRLAERVLPPDRPCACTRGPGPGAVLESAAMLLEQLDAALRASAEDQQAAARRARHAETELVQARVLAVRLQEEVQRLRAEADQLTAQGQEHAQARARARERIRTLTGQAELWRSVARSLESEKVVQERELAGLREKLTLAKLPQEAEEDKRCLSLRGALRDSREEITALQGQKHALQAALRSMETSSQRGAKERQELLSALNNARQTLRLESERRCAMMADERRRLGEERRSERGAWEQERSRLVAERARAEAESVELRSTCVSLQARAEQCAQELARMEDTVLRQCEERDTLLRSLALPAPAPAPAPAPDPSPTPASPPQPVGSSECHCKGLQGTDLPPADRSAPAPAPAPLPSPPPAQPAIPFTIDAVRPPNNRRVAPGRRAKKCRNNERVRKRE